MRWLASCIGVFVGVALITVLLALWGGGYLAMLWWGLSQTQP